MEIYDPIKNIPGQRVRITEFDPDKSLVGMEGVLVTNLSRYHSIIGDISIFNILMIDSNASCIGIVGNEKSVL